MRTIPVAMLVFFTCFSLGTLSAFAATPKWDAITLNDQGMFFIDAHSIKDEGGRKILWSAMDYKKPQSTADGVAYSSIQTQLQINCKAKMARVMHMTYFSGPMLTGKQVGRQGMLHDWLEIDPTSAIHKIARRVC
ncbi:surface-adhesin E family protein [Limnohabitans sp.]|uniref:surface-adhesin E family protein n=2 Tax=Limnohabitans sp. TaxID=1907725 RepID=UPI00391AECB9